MLKFRGDDVGVIPPRDFVWLGGNDGPEGWNILLCRNGLRRRACSKSQRGAWDWKVWWK